MEPKTARSCPNSPKARSELEARDRAPGSSHTLGDTDTHTAPVSVSHTRRVMRLPLRGLRVRSRVPAAFYTSMLLS
ncbi:hypothetical protein CMEL01_06081 [Colletotrichum melonis]|uniref:Uncharacterized protein n=1 Tax=Colletotrichum melonis TaxID=1209925 RepID=A0AAI9XIM7_9PEZI|nr:hypothetical protein CMEL01_06081 [Colletotrichum melonis]